MLVDDVNVHVRGGINEVEEKAKPIRAKLTNDVGLLQLEMSGTEKGKDGKTNMLLPNSILVSRIKKLEPRRENWNYADCSAQGSQMGVVLMSTWVCKNSGRHSNVETVALAGMVRCAESCWRSNSYTQELGTRRSAQPRIGAFFAAKLVQCTED